MPRILLLDPIAPEGLALLQAEPSIEFEEKLGLKGEALREALANADAAIVRSGVKITAESLEGNRRLKAIARAGVGTDNIDKDAATRRGIVVMNTPTGNTVSTAEHAFALMLALSRSVAPAYQSLCAGRWDRKSYMGSQLAGKTLGIVGLGRIGQAVAKRANAFEMTVLGFDPFLPAESAERLGIRLCDTVADMLPELDYLTVHTPLTPETRNLIDLDTLGKLKPGVRLINCARGGIYNEAALVEGLKRGILGGVALDVFDEEPCTDSPLFGMPNVVCTPHLGASTEEAQTQVAVEAVQLILKFLATGEVRHAVNVASIDPTTLASARNLLQVAYRLGRFASQWHGGRIDKMRISCRGNLASRDANLLTAAVCAGILEQVVVESPNLINAPVLCRERGISIVEEKMGDPVSFDESIVLEVSGAGKTLAIGGTLFGNDMPRLFKLNDHRLEAYLDGHLVVFHHQDRPGIIGSVGSILGRHAVNIAQMSVGRVSHQRCGTAIGVLNLDSAVPADALSEILSTDGIDAVHAIELPGAGTSPSWLGSA